MTPSTADPAELEARLDELIAELLSDRPVDAHARYALAEEAGEIAGRLGRRALVADMLRRRADYRLHTGAFQPAVDAANAALEIYREMGLRLGIGATLLALSGAELQLCLYDVAEKHAREALEILRETGERRREANALVVLGLVHWCIGEFEEATEAYVAAMEIEEQDGNLDGIAGVLTNIGLIGLETEDFEGALASFERSLGLFRQVGNRSGEAVALKNIGDALIGLGRIDEALGRERECVAIATALGERHYEAAGLDGIGCALVEKGSFVEALEHLERSLAIKEEIGERQGMVETLMNMGRAAARQGRFQEGRGRLERAIAIIHEIGARPLEARAHLTMSDLLESAGEPGAALEEFKQFHRLRTELTSESSAARVRRLRGQLELADAQRVAEVNRLRAERLEHEFELARRVQTGLLPQAPPSVAGMEIACRCLPALKTGGDYFDFFSLGERRLGIVVGDVTGKGLPAAIYMTLVKGILGATVAERASPSEILIDANRLVHRMFPRGSFVTMVYAIVDLDAGELTYASAGHNPLLQLRSGDVLVHCEHGMALGLAGSDLFAPTVRDSTIALRPGDSILLYSDGLVEAMDSSGGEFGLGRLAGAFAAAIEEVGGGRRDEMPGATLDGALDGTVARIIAEIDSFTSGRDRHDDMTAVAIRLLG